MMADLVSGEASESDEEYIKFVDVAPSLHVLTALNKHCFYNSRFSLFLIDTQ